MSEPVETCENCGAAIALIRPLGAYHEDDRIHVHRKTYRAACGFRDSEGRPVWATP